MNWIKKVRQYSFLCPSKNEYYRVFVLWRSAYHYCDWLFLHNYHQRPLENIFDFSLKSQKSASSLWSPISILKPSWIDILDVSLLSTSIVLQIAIVDHTIRTVFGRSYCYLICSESCESSRNRISVWSLFGEQHLKIYRINIYQTMEMACVFVLIWSRWAQGGTYKSNESYIELVQLFYHRKEAKRNNFDSWTIRTTFWPFSEEFTSGRICYQKMIHGWQGSKIYKKSEQKKWTLC